MYKLVYESPYTAYTAGEYLTLEDCQRACKTRYGLRNEVFGQDDEGTLYTALWADDALVTLKLYDMNKARQ